MYRSSYNHLLCQPATGMNTDVLAHTVLSTCTGTRTEYYSTCTVSPIVPLYRDEYTLGLYCNRTGIRSTVGYRHISRSANQESSYKSSGAVPVDKRLGCIATALQHTRTLQVYCSSDSVLRAYSVLSKQVDYTVRVLYITTNIYI